MNWASGFFLPALAAAALPLVIHLLNRRRYRTIEWAAMDFLREAVHRNRRLLVLRDVVLLALRTAAVALFVLAMARPYHVASSQSTMVDQPVHAVLVIDNSLSMGYTQLDKSLLELAKEKAATFIRDLPDGSKVSLAPMCDYGDWQGRNVYGAKDAALEALGKIELVDRKARAGAAAEAAAAACRAAPDLPTKRVVFLGDVQAETWSTPGLAQSFKELADVQVVQMAPKERANTSVTEWRVRDGAADAKTPAVFVGTVRHEGPAARSGVRAALKIDEEIVEERLIDLVPGQNLELMFQHTFAVAGTPREPVFHAVKLELAGDNLPQDDQRTLIVPVVANLPVVFVDQCGRDEDPRRNKYGETFPLRRLLAPRTQRGEDEKHLVDVRHRKMEELTVEELRDARLVVIAGVRGPDERAAGLLREYIEQGGVVFIAAGGEFEPGAWQTAWRDGAGILPAPLKPTPVGKLPPPEAVDAPAFHLAAATLVDEAFHLDLPLEERQEVYTAPFFYKAVCVDAEAMGKLAEAEASRLEQGRKWLAELEANEKTWAEQERRGELKEDARRKREADRETAKRMRPDWLAWKPAEGGDVGALSVADAVQRSMPRVMGRYDNGEVFAVRRDVGRGRVVMMTTGCYPQWNNLAAEYSVVLLDKALRGLLSRTLPVRTFGEVREVVVPVDAAEQAAEFRVTAPQEEDGQRVKVEARGGESYGLILRSVQKRGVYKIERKAAGEGKADGWTMAIAMNGPAEESELASLSEETLTERLDRQPFRWLSAGEDIRLEGATRSGQNYWKWLMSAVLALLAAEMVFLGVTGVRGNEKVTV